MENNTLFLESYARTSGTHRHITDTISCRGILAGIYIQDGGHRDQDKNDGPQMKRPAFSAEILYLRIYPPTTSLKLGLTRFISKNFSRLYVFRSKNEAVL